MNSNPIAKVLNAPPEDFLSPDLEDYKSAIEGRIAGVQLGVPTFFDNFVLGSLNNLGHKYAAGEKLSAVEHSVLTALQRDAQLRISSRLVGCSDRYAESETWKQLPWEAGTNTIIASQGVSASLSWRGMPLFKSVYDFAMYPMLLEELRPATIIELGAGSGASSVWLADVCQALAMDVSIYAVDLKPLHLKDSRVHFLQGDCSQIERTLPPDMLLKMKRPWMVIEDVHVNTRGILRHLADLSEPGDYLIVEDSRPKQAEIKGFDGESCHHFKIDTRYTDFFGRNVTTAFDSIFVCVEDGQ